MKIIDLSQTLYSSMPVWEGDPEVKIKQIHTIDNISIEHFQKIILAEPKFVIIGNKAELTVELERKLLENKIITITDLVNMEKLPKNKEFMFYGVPLKIKDRDGSPIRAFAIIE
ncbi:hypothetical protein CO178_01625 [candidate division WWE3 bacterium CG_4_9_14_3_um_filter_34_6]|uniref:Cyclase n=1 Tax=candidate division WWE3 bacterium CG_4_9_14_3_um_filter_34_6 TaxID=1975079 RepID=A0A2M7X3J5_UNCKA|nr:MAG: hypothetical protein CO178_01625 [candidate division WWE3 bacterium CG_4_9_14_3_um_filter_34_6]